MFNYANGQRGIIFIMKINLTVLIFVIDIGCQINLINTSEFSIINILSFYLYSYMYSVGFFIMVSKQYNDHIIESRENGPRGQFYTLNPLDHLCLLMG